MTEPTADVSYRALLNVPSLPRVLLGMTIARVGGAMVSITLVVFTLARFHSPALAGLVTFVSIFPGLLIAPLAGAILDRHGRTRFVVLDYVVAAVSLWLIGGLALAGLLTPELLVLIAFVSSLTGPLSVAGLRSLLPLLVPHQLWERANAIDSNGYVVATLIGPPSAGALVAVFGGPTALVAIGFVLALAALVCVGIPDPDTNVATHGGIFRDAWEGLKYTLRNPTLRALGLSISALNMGGGMAQIVIPVIILDHLHESPIVVGLSWAVLGIAGMAAALIFGRIDSRGREKDLLLWPALGIAGATSLLFLADTFGLPIVLIGFAIVGFLNGPSDIGLFTIRQRRTDPAWMGRAFAVSMAFNFIGFPVGSAISGALVETSLPLTIGFGVAACLAGAFFTWWLLPAQADPIGERNARAGSTAEAAER
jgi:MFS family permease